MDWKKELEEAHQLTRDRRFELAATKYKEIIEGSEGEPVYHYWAIKHFADIVGMLFMKDYFRAIDMYQKIINEYEEEDGLYEWCQVDMAKTYMLCGMEMFESYDNMMDMLEPIDNHMAEYIEGMKEKRDDYFTDRAEVIYKSRM
ncbi:hypothetical protein EZV73_07150 [Acidaminobacter sp. JC074]|uniref:hypothetical protein n=1 Tax=Acidaminobacter sp. JC074 TaxID=2530199 RepID=UPI001F0D94E8|nr:hypothetical protein [Acidaminobacter sp. JC074]MCH4887341.1 hypothetical protein [Acidaminobacter sp. JC074]